MLGSMRSSRFCMKSGETRTKTVSARQGFKSFLTNEEPAKCCICRLGSPLTKPTLNYISSTIALG